MFTYHTLDIWYYPSMTQLKKYDEKKVNRKIELVCIGYILSLCWVSKTRTSIKFFKLDCDGGYGNVRELKDWNVFSGHRNRLPGKVT